MAFSKVGLPASSNPLVNDLVTSLFDEETTNNPFAFEPPLPAQWKWNTLQPHAKVSLPNLSSESVWKPEPQSHNCPNVDLGTRSIREFAYANANGPSSQGAPVKEPNYYPSQYSVDNTPYSRHGMAPSQSFSPDLTQAAAHVRDRFSNNYPKEMNSYAPRPNQAPHFMPPSGRPSKPYFSQSSLDISVDSACSSDIRSASFEHAFDSHLLLAKLSKLFPGRTLNDLANIPVDVIAQQLEATQLGNVPNNYPPSSPYHRSAPAFTNPVEPRMGQRYNEAGSGALQCSSPVDRRDTAPPPVFFAENSTKDYYNQVRLYPCNAELAEAIHDKPLAGANKEEDPARARIALMTLLRACLAQVRALSCERQGKDYDQDAASGNRDCFQTLVIESHIEYEKLMDFVCRLKHSDLVEEFAEHLKNWEGLLEALRCHSKKGKLEGSLHMMNFLLHTFGRSTAKLRGLLRVIYCQQLQTAEELANRSHCSQFLGKFPENGNEY